MRWAQAIFLLSFVFSAGMADAQVHRCTDAAGKLTFSDRQCAGSQRGELLHRRPSERDIIQERKKAYGAELLKQERRIAEQERDWQDQQRRAQAPHPAQVVGAAAPGWQNSHEQRNDRVSASSITKNGGAWDSAAEERRKRERREAQMRLAAQNPVQDSSSSRPPVDMARCTSQTCQDAQGKSYTRVPTNPNLMYGPDRSTCNKNGDSNGGGWLCR